MKQFMNAELKAPNVLEIDVDLEIVKEFTAIVDGLLQRAPWHSSTLTEKDFFSSHPKWDSDIQWISVDTEAAYEFFCSRFSKLGIQKHVAPYIDYEKELIVYSAFVVTRSVCRNPNFHADWVGANNDAFTLLTPISDNADEFRLLYKNMFGHTSEYKYKLGKALILGDRFVHSSGADQSDTPLVLLSYTFGTDRMTRWDAISKTAAKQGDMFRQPDGQFIRRGLRCKN